MKTTKEDFKNVKNDINGNPRFVCSFWHFVKDNEEGLPLAQQLAFAAQRAKKLGGQKYRGKDFGGGFVFVSYNLESLCEKITKIRE